LWNSCPTCEQEWAGELELELAELHWSRLAEAYEQQPVAFLGPEQGEEELNRAKETHLVLLRAHGVMPSNNLANAVQRKFERMQVAIGREPATNEEGDNVPAEGMLILQRAMLVSTHAICCRCLRFSGPF
jgi:hypothetical protein